MTEASAASQGGARDGRWRPAPAVRISAVVHAAGAGALAVHPESWPWITGALGCNWLGLFAAVFFPRGRLLGPNLVRLPEAAARRGEICLTFDDGPDPEITPRVLDLLDRRGAKASFFCVGEYVTAYPEIAREIARRGHSVESHSYGHSNAFALYGLGGLRRDVQAAQAAIAGITGREPRFFRAPAGFRSPLLDPVLAALDLRYVSWTKRGFDTVDRNAARVLRRLTRGLAAGDVLVLHDSVPIVLEVLPLLLDQLDAQGLKPVSLPVACGDGSAP